MVVHVERRGVPAVARVLLAVGLLAGLASACGGHRTAPGVLSVRATTYGPIVTDASGRSLYLYVDDRTDPVVSTCTGGCADDWPPVPAPAPGAATGGPVSAPVGSSVRSGGSRQLSLGGYPLYYFTGDRVPGDTRGEGIAGVWYLVAPTGNPIAFTDPVFDVAGPTIRSTLGTRPTTSGPIVTDAEGQTVYVTRRDRPDTTTCTASWCLQDWPPLLATATPTAGVGIGGAVGTLRRGDGTLQVTLDGHPLYLFSGDLAPGDVRGEGVGGQWFAAGAAGSPVLAVPDAGGPARPVGPVLAPPLPPLAGLVPGPSGAAYVAFTLEGDVDDGAAPGGCWSPVAARGPGAGSYRHDLYFPVGTACDSGRWGIDVELYDSPAAAVAAGTGSGGAAVYRYYDVVAVVAGDAPAALVRVLGAIPGLVRIGGNQPGGS